VLGSIYLSGNSFNMVSGINLVLAVGLSVDAVAHITHSFLAADGTGNERSLKALVDIGRLVTWCTYHMLQISSVFVRCNIITLH
jgi:hypothetical protein